MSALRVARARTGRDLLLKFDGCYHGHGDSFLVRAGSGVATLGLPNSPGVPAALAALTLTVPYNDVAAVEVSMRQHADRVAAIIVEPVIGNAGFIPPDPAFLPALRRVADEHGTLLIFDEVMTGFRIAPGGAAERFGVTADLTTLGKVIGGGVPVAAYGGRFLVRGGDCVVPEGQLLASRRHVVIEFESYAVAKACDHGRTTRKDAAGAILYAAEKATWMAGEAIQALGGNGYINDYPTGRLLRDAKLYEIGAGTSEIRRWLIGRELFQETS